MADNIETISYINLGDGENHPIDAVTVGGKTLPSDSSFLPSVTSSDNGKVLRVINGQWVLVEPAIIYSGDGIPSDESGKNGDVYIQTGEITPSVTEATFYYVPSESAGGDTVQITYESGMTWGEFCNSSYNNHSRFHFWVDVNDDLFPTNAIGVNIDESGDDALTYDQDHVYADQLIIANETYIGDDGNGGDEE